MTALFAYGTLMCTDIMVAVAGCSLESRPAILHDFVRYSMHNERYPGIIPHKGGKVPGVVYCNLRPEALERLDEFEGEYYQRRIVTVHTDKRQTIAAMAYIIKVQYRHLLSDSQWHYEDFLRHGKEEFIRAYTGFHRI